MRSLQLKVTVGVLLALILTQGFASYLYMWLLERRRLNALETETAVLGSSLEGSLELAMLGKRRDELQIMLQRVAMDPEVQKVFILNNQGEVKLSSDSLLLNKEVSTGRRKMRVLSFRRAQGTYPCNCCFRPGRKEFLERSTDL